MYFAEIIPSYFLIIRIQSLIFLDSAGFGGIDQKDLHLCQKAAI
jgi:hypothetical protein